MLSWREMLIHGPSYQEAKNNNIRVRTLYANAPIANADPVIAFPFPLALQLTIINPTRLQGAGLYKFSDGLIGSHLDRFGCGLHILDE